MFVFEFTKKTASIAGTAGTIGALILASLFTQNTALAQQDEEWLPIVRIAPVYPPRAAARGLEGYVVVEYTITETGSVEDVTVVESSATLFDAAAVDSVSKFKYQPRVENGRSVAVPGIRSVIRFELERPQE